MGTGTTPTRTSNRWRRRRSPIRSRTAERVDRPGSQLAPDFADRTSPPWVEEGYRHDEDQRSVHGVQGPTETRRDHSRHVPEDETAGAAVPEVWREDVQGVVRDQSLPRHPSAFCPVYSCPRGTMTS